MFEEWSHQPPGFKVKAENKTQVLQLPFLHNPDITYLSSSLACSSLTQAEMHRVRDILGRQGQIDTEKILNVMRKKKIRFRRKQIINMCKKIEEGLPPEWRQVFSKSTAKVQNDNLNFLLLTSPNPKSIQNTTKQRYTTLHHFKSRRDPPQNHIGKKYSQIKIYPQFGTT